MSRIILAALAALALAGCQPAIKVVRADGRPMEGNPALIAQFDKDAAICKGEGAKAGLSAAGHSNPLAVRAVQEGCMAERGYTTVRPS